MEENKIPGKNLEELETTEYADGDFDLGVWQEEIADMRADDIAAGDSAGKKRGNQQ